MGWHPLIDAAEVPPDRGMVVDGPGAQFAVFVVAGRSYVLENTCPHRGGDLGMGYVDPNGCVYCPLHAWPFKLETGESPTHPGAKVRVYASRIEQGKVEVLLDAAQGVA